MSQHELDSKVLLASLLEKRDSVIRASPIGAPEIFRGGVWWKNIKQNK